MATSTAAHTPLHPMTSAWILWLWVPFLASLSHCPKPCFSLTSCALLPQHLHDATFSSDCSCTVLVSFIVCLFLPSFTFPLQPTVLWFHLPLYRLFFFFFLPKVTNDLLIKPSDSCRASWQFWPSLFVLSLFLTFWLHSAFTSSVSEMLAVTCWWISDSCIPEGKTKTNKQTPLMCNAFWFLWCRYSHRGPFQNDQHKITECRIEKRCEQLCLSTSDLSQLQHTTNSLSSFISLLLKIGVLWKCGFQVEVHVFHGFYKIIYWVWK